MVARNISELSSELQMTRPSIRTMQAELRNVRAKRSGAVMVLSMDIVGDGAADGDELGAGSDWKKPAFGKKYLDDIGEG